MTKRKQCAALALALTLTISMFGCEKDKETTQSSAVSQIKTSDSAQPSNVKVKEYKFPEFLNKIKSLDELSRKLYTSFEMCIRDSCTGEGMVAINENKISIYHISFVFCGNIHIIARKLFYSFFTAAVSLDRRGV